MQITAHLILALLFGGMTLFSFGFAPLLFNSLDPSQARITIRKAFPFLLYFINFVHAILISIICLSTIPTRQILMPAINRMTDTGNTKSFKLLHALSVMITLLHIVISGYVLSDFG
jgi:Domain of unknown function (DUF4149)